MRKSMFFLCLVVLACFGNYHSLVFAEEATTSDATTTPENAPQPTASEPTPRSEQRGALSAAAQARLTNLAANVSNRMDAYVRRITNVTDRLESRATKLEATGIDVTVARAKIAEARTELEKARFNLSTIDNAVAGFVGSENPRTYWQQVKNTYLATRDAIKGGHRATVETLLLLQTATPPPLTGTTTESVPDTVE